MLILTRKSGESINIGEEIKITILEIKGNQVRVGIQAPRNVAVHREEIYQLIKKQNILAAKQATNNLEKLSRFWEEKHREET